MIASDLTTPREIKAQFHGPYLAIDVKRGVVILVLNTLMGIIVHSAHGGKHKVGGFYSPRRLNLEPLIGEITLRNE